MGSMGSDDAMAVLEMAWRSLVFLAAMGDDPMEKKMQTAREKRREREREREREGRKKKIVVERETKREGGEEEEED
ncbi:unnamed protein product [Prunus armeniaca]